MSESDVLFRWLGRAATRIRLNERFEDLGCLVIGLSVLVIVYQLLRVTIRLPAVMAGLLPLFVLAAGGVIGFFAWRVIGRDLFLYPDRQRAAAVADARAGLNNELSSAWWFVSSSSSADLVNVHVARAAQKVQRLDPARVLPLAFPHSFAAAVVLLMVAALTVQLQPRAEFAVDESVDAGAAAQRTSRVMALGEDGSVDDFLPDDPADGSAGMAWLKIEKLASELRAGPQADRIAEAIAARDARTASRLLAGTQREQAAQPASGQAARPDAEQMSETLAGNIVERLQSLLNEGGGWSGQATDQSDVDAAQRLTDQLTRELREEMDGAESGLPGEMSPEERALNTTLEAMSRESTGGDEVIRGEANPMQGLGRTSVGSGAMGRRINVSTGGAGDGEQPHGNPQGDAEAQPVLGAKTLRLQLKMQTVTIDQKDVDISDGSEESFYAATQAQAAGTQYEEVVAQQHEGAETDAGAQQLPLAYRDAVKEYTARQHRRERTVGQ